jgi:nicotinate-nucleotide pyrophosphorylase
MKASGEGGVNLTTVASIAQTGMDQMVVGALNHSARILGRGLDWF